MALRGRAGYPTAQMAPLVADIVARAVKWVQKVGYSKEHHHDLDLTRWDGVPFPAEVKVRCCWSRLASLREDPMGQKQVPYPAAGRRPPPSLAFGVLVHGPSHYGHGLSSRVPLDLVLVAWCSCQPAKFDSVSKVPLTFQRTHLFVPWITRAFSAW